MYTWDFVPDSAKNLFAKTIPSHTRPCRVYSDDKYTTWMGSFDIEKKRGSVQTHHMY